MGRMECRHSLVARSRSFRSRERMGFKPKPAGSRKRIYSHVLPPCPSLSERWISRWCVRQSGTVNSSLTLRPSARHCAKRKR